MTNKNQPGPLPAADADPLPAAYGGPGWSPRTRSHREEIGEIWSDCGQDSEWGPLKAVLLHRPGRELAQIPDSNTAQLLEQPDLAVLQAQHTALGEAYIQAGVRVHHLRPDAIPPPNQMYVADLMWMTPEGALVGRPASTVRAGEETHVARRLAALRIPILATIRGTGTFEGADAAWLNPQTVLLATGLRTNPAGADQVAAILAGLGVQVLRTELPPGAMHLMGCLRFADRDLALTRPGQTPPDAIGLLQDLGFQVHPLPNEAEIRTRGALNFVTLGPRRILVPAGTPETHAFYEDLGIELVKLPVDELIKCAGGIGCLTGVIERDLVIPR